MPVFSHFSDDQRLISLLSSLYISINSYMRREEGYTIGVQPFVEALQHCTPFTISQAQLRLIEEQLIMLENRVL